MSQCPLRRNYSKLFVPEPEPHQLLQGSIHPDTEQRSDRQAYEGDVQENYSHRSKSFALES